MSLEKQFCGPGRCGEAHKVGKKGGGQGIAGAADTGCAEINADGVESGLRGAQHDCRRPADLGIHAVDLHQARPHGQSRAAADGPHQHQQGAFRRNAEEGKQRPAERLQQLRCPGGAEQLHGGEQQNEGGEDVLQQAQPLCPAL